MIIDKSYIYLIHILLVSPLLILSGYIGDKLSKRENEKYKKIFWLLISVGIFVFLYHSFLLLKIKNIL